MSLEVSPGVCVGVRVRRSKKGGRHTRCRSGCRLVCVWGQGSQVQDGQDGAVTEGVAGGVVWCVGGSGFADPKGGCHRRCRWRRRLAVTQSVAGGVVWCVWGQGSQIQNRGAVTEGVVGGVAWCVCVGVRVRRSKRGLSQKVSLEGSSGVCGGQGSQIQKGAVTQGVAGGVVWCVWGSGFAGPRRGCHRGCRWRRRLVCMGSGFADLKQGAVTEGVVGGVAWCMCGGQGLQSQQIEGVVGGVAWCVWGSGFADPKGGCLPFPKAFFQDFCCLALGKLK